MKPSKYLRALSHIPEIRRSYLKKRVWLSTTDINLVTFPAQLSSTNFVDRENSNTNTKSNILLFNLDSTGDIGRKKK